MDISNRIVRLYPLLAQSARLTERYLSGDTRQTAEAFLHSTEKETVEVMLYGAYNAGKSTTINMLLGRDEAKVQDRPTTDSIDPFDWNGITLLDTPGLNAPIEHEECTQNHLAKADLVLLVIRDGDQDAAGVYDRLFTLIKNDRSVFIVLNHTETSAENAEPQLRRLNTLLVRKGAEAGLDIDRLGTIPVLALNAEMALFGRKQNEPDLLAASGYNDFIDQFERWLKDSTEVDTRLRRLCQRFEGAVLTPLTQTLEAQCASVGSDVEKRSALIGHLKEQKTRLIAQARNKAITLCNEYKGQIGTLIDTPNTTSASINAQLQVFMTDASSTLSAWIQTELTSIAADLTIFTETTGVSLSTQDVDTEGSFDFGTLLQTLDAGAAGKGVEIFNALIDKINKTVTFQIPKIPIAYVGPILEATKFLYGLYASVRANQAAQDAAIRKVQSITTIADKMGSALANHAEEVIRSHLDQQITREEQALKDLTDAMQDGPQKDLITVATLRQKAAAL
ncbi:GTPase [Novispirillum itersonii]|uniref:G domain-containing protein n=1 Tax=Novispirillum itersonii TaxID=189 RepID=A0A7X0DLQ0_NOVIT|nr:GTPase [Novispirillum itersonii]MBB6210225.1 hypothetical protein [Novispirillum itersonii]